MVAASGLIWFREDESQVFLTSFMRPTPPGYKTPRAYFRHIDRYLKNGFSESIVHMIKYANFQLYMVHPDGVI